MRAADWNIHASVRFVPLVLRLACPAAAMSFGVVLLSDPHKIYQNIPLKKSRKNHLCFPSAQLQSILIACTTRIIYADMVFSLYSVYTMLYFKLTFIYKGNRNFC